MQIRNIAIIAHVDHGKTTLVDAMLKQTHTFRDNQKEMGESLIMDSNDLEREKGITILSKNTSVMYKNTKINIIDTPGHADFGGEVERILNMASGAILLVDAAEGPLPQTKFVLKKALEARLKIILLINKIDKRDARPQEVMREVENLFLELAHHESVLHFTTLYSVGRDGKVFRELPDAYTSEMPGDLSPLFDTVISEIPDSAVCDDGPFQMLVSTLDYDSYVGKLCIGKVSRGKLKINDTIVLVDDQKVIGRYRAQKLYTSVGLVRQEVKEIRCGDILALAGIPQLTIGQTVADPLKPESLPTITIEDPTLKVTIGPNTSPLSGREGTLKSSAQIKERLLKEKETNLGLTIEPDPTGSNFTVAGRGELHLAILIETMRREGFELQVGKPEVILKTVDSAVCEPFEEMTIDVGAEFVGVITEELAKRRGQMRHMGPVNDTTTRFVYTVSTRNLLGIRNVLLTRTRGTSLLSTYFTGYLPRQPTIDSHRGGAMIATNSGVSSSYGLENAQERGTLFIGPGVSVYKGMVVGISSRPLEVEINVCKEKKQTNMRSSGADQAIQLTPPKILELEVAIDLLDEDEFLEVTPKSIRIRKKHLIEAARRIARKKVEAENDNG